MIATIGILGCYIAIVLGACSLAATLATGIANAVISQQAADDQKEANSKAEARQRKGQAAQRIADKKRANALRQQAAYGIILSMIDMRQANHEANATNKKYAGKTGRSGASSRVPRGNYPSGTPAQ